MALPLKKTKSLSLIVDRCKSNPRIREFNQIISTALQEKFHNLEIIDIDHMNSYEAPCLQIIDMPSWGIFRKYEKGDLIWYETYQQKIKAEIMIDLN